MLYEVITHTAVFLTNTEPQVIQAIPQSSEVIMNNCIRCHTQLNTEFVNRITSYNVCYTKLLRYVMNQLIVHYKKQ